MFVFSRGAVGHLVCGFRVGTFHVFVQLLSLVPSPARPVGTI